MQIGSNPFVGTLQRHDTDLRRKEKEKSRSSFFSLSYILDLSPLARKFQQQYKDDDYPIINPDVFCYKKNLDLEYKSLR